MVGLRSWRGDFDSYEDAEDHPVKMSDWKRVWIELISPPLMANDE